MQLLKNGQNWQKKLVITVAALFIVIILIAITVIIISQPKNSTTLNQDEKKLQSSIQASLDRSDARIANILFQDGNWRIVQLNSTDNRDNYTMVITNNDQVVLGPSSDFSIDSLAANSIPDSLIDYLYPSKPQWINFNDSFNSYFQYSQSQVKFIIQFFAQQQNIELKRVTLVDGNVTYRDENPRDDNRIEYTEFSFTLNSDPTVYKFQSKYTAIDLSTIYSIFDEQGNVVYSQKVDL